MVNILGIRVSRLSPKKIQSLLQQWLEEDAPRFIATPNPEIILAAQKDEELFHILNQADLAPADGFGLKVAAWNKGTRLHRFTGADMTRFLLQQAQARKLRVTVVCWQDGLSRGQDIAKALERIFPDLKHQELAMERKNDLSPENLAKIISFRPDILFITLGSPWQEKLAFHHYRQIPGLRLALGVGGSFDFITNKIKRAPLAIRKMGIEWLWRLAKQPRRLRRIFNATIVFTYKDIIDSFIYPLRYRPNVAVMIYKIEQGQPYILLVERSDEDGHWQLPQGGTEGESLEQAARREMKEELGIEIEVDKTFPEVYRYIRGNRKLKKRGYKGQSQGLAIAHLTSKEEEISINYWDHQSWTWIRAEEALEKIHPIRRPASEKFLKLFKNYLETYGK